MNQVVNDLLINLMKLLLALAIGTIIGIEREKSGKPVGIRTLSLVCVGSTFLTMITMSQFPDEVARVLAGIVTGIGFLGAGSIIAHGEMVKGLTTAAALWTISIIGMGIGMGEYILSGAVALIIYAILILGKIEHKMLGIKDNEQQNK